MNFTLSSDFAIVADMGPGNAAATTPASATREQMIEANTPNHGGDGQNVLYGDGHAEWTSTIFCGSPRPVSNSPRDNIYAHGVDASASTPSAGTRGAPQDQYDSVILPMADVGFQPGPFGPRISPPLRWNRIIAMVGGGILFVGACAVLIVLYLKRKPRPGV
jgi:prepilin-type processing-associated H-X9-DG protein